MTRRRLAAALLVALAPLAGPAAADPPPEAASLGEAERSDIARIEDYLNRLGTVQARFLQISSNGGFAEGDIHISRPGKMRIEYDPPSPILIVANGRHLIYFDKELEQVSYMGLDSTPAGILLKEQVSFLGGGFTVTFFERSPGVLRLTLVKTDDPLEGSLSLVFNDRPMSLKKWIVTDAQGVVTTVSLMDVRFGAPLNPELFRFKNPKRLGDRYDR